MSLPNRFTVRVYGVLMNNEHEVLIFKEQIQSKEVIKFPGGGLEFGEGPAEGILREIKEETGIEAVIKEHLYTSDFYIQSHFRPEEQVIGIYYLLEPVGRESVKILEDDIEHIWIDINELEPALVTFEMDKAAVRALKEKGAS